MAWSIWDIGCCCAGCTACADPFTRSNNTDISSGAPTGCSYTQYGEQAWEVVSNSLHNTSSSGNSLAIVAPGSGDADEMAVRATFNVTTMSTGKRVGLVFDFVDDENYRFVDIYITSATTGKWNLTYRYGTVVATVETIVDSHLYYYDTSFPSGIVDAEMCVHKSGGDIVAYYMINSDDGYSFTVTHPGSATLDSGLFSDTEYAVADDFLLYHTLASGCPACDTFTCASTPGLHYFTSDLSDDFSSDTSANYDIVWAIDHPDGTETVSGGLLTLEHPDGSLDAEVRALFHAPIHAETIEMDVELTSSLATTSFSIFSVWIEIGDSSLAKLQYDFPGSSADVTLTGGTAPGTDNIGSRATTLRLVLTATHVGSGYYDLTGKIYYGATLMSTVTSDDYFNSIVASVENGKQLTGCGVKTNISFDLTATSTIDVDISIDSISVSWT